VSPLPFADPLSIGEAPHHFESHPTILLPEAVKSILLDIAIYVVEREPAQAPSIKGGASSFSGRPLGLSVEAIR
jgi:hypothetical protein